MRDLSTDRPDQTESPYTVDAGHFQVEMDLVKYTRDRSGGVTYDSWLVAPMNWKVGLLNNVDLQWMIDSYQRDRVVDRPAGTVTRVDGFGDMQTRLKVNLWGNDGGRTAFALMPFGKWPTAKRPLGNGEVEGGMIALFTVELVERWSLTLMNEVDFMHDAFGDGYHAEYVNSITVAHEITDALGAYLEFFTVAGQEAGGAWEGQVDLGVTYGLTADIQLDAGVNLGVTESAPDVQPFVGVTVRY